MSPLFLHYCSICTITVVLPVSVTLVKPTPEIKFLMPMQQVFYHLMLDVCHKMHRRKHNCQMLSVTWTHSSKAALSATVKKNLWDLNVLCTCVKLIYIVRCTSLLDRCVSDKRFISDFYRSDILCLC